MPTPFFISFKTLYLDIRSFLIKLTKYLSKIFLPVSSSKLYLNIKTLVKYFKIPTKPISMGTEIIPFPPLFIESVMVLIDLSKSVTCSSVSKQETFSN